MSNAQLIQSFWDARLAVRRVVILNDPSAPLDLRCSPGAVCFSLQPMGEEPPNAEPSRDRI